jgi:DnaJ-class molecular chaperone
MSDWFLVGQLRRFASFREECSCCKGAREHHVCSIIPQKCDTCDGTGLVLNQLGWDMLKLLKDRQTAEQVS